jgi:hypothetical protein
MTELRPFGRYWQGVQAVESAGAGGNYIMFTAYTFVLIEILVTTLHHRVGLARIE